MSRAKWKSPYVSKNLTENFKTNKNKKYMEEILLPNEKYIEYT